MLKFIYFYISATAASIFLLYSCSQITKVTDAIVQPSQREIYSREFKELPAIYDAWQQMYQSAINENLDINLPFGESGNFLESRNSVYSFTIAMKKGEILTAEIVKDSLKPRVFMDIFELRNGVYKSVQNNDSSQNTISFPIKDSGEYKLLMQPEINAKGNFFLTINRKPLYDFPVSGKGNNAIQSFWSDVRDGGKRSHEGVDIFAQRGTPVLAVTEGLISDIGDRGLGGKQVWQRDGFFGNSIYYAHLDQIATTAGSRVRSGDTIGFVGNTGNAKTTSPHLHFGIYQGYGGAVNPLPYIYKTENLKRKNYTQKFKSSTLRIKSAVATLRGGPDKSATKIGELKKNDTLYLIGENKEWLHIQLPTGNTAFVNSTLISEAK